MMRRWSNFQAGAMLAGGLALGLLLGGGVARWTGGDGENPPHRRGAADTLLHASGAEASGTFAMATGWVDDEVEGLFTLDYLTGDLQCLVFNPQTMRFGAWFKRNIIADLGGTEGLRPRYVLVAGETMMLRGAAATAPANCVIYVADANSGKIAAYGVRWNRTAARAGVPQTGTLELLDTGRGRTVVIRD